MIKELLSVTVILLMLLTSGIPALKASELPKLKNLSSGTPEFITKNSSISTVAMIFQPNCSWCKKQSIMFNALQQQCKKNINTVLIGHKGSVIQLKHELKLFNSEIKSFQTNRAFLKKINGVNAFPTTVFFDNKGNLIAKKRGYIQPQKFIHAINLLTHEQCQLKFDL